MKKLFLRSGKLWVGEFPEEPIPYGVGDEQYYGARMDDYNAAVSAAKASAVEVVNPEDALAQNCLEEDKKIWMIINPDKSYTQIIEGQLHDLPQGWTMEIENNLYKKVARLVPLVGIPEIGEKQTELDMDEIEELVKHHQSHINYYRSRIAVLRGELASPPPQAESGKKCPKCGSGNVIMFSSDLDLCKACGYSF